MNDTSSQTDTSASRRRVLKGAAASALALAPMPLGAGLAQSSQSLPTPQPGPATVEPTAGRGGHVLRIAETQVNPDGRLPVRAITINGSLPGPELRFREGDILRVVLENGLVSEATTLHWHGLLLPSAMDGVPGISQEPVAAGECFVYEFPLIQSGTFWYHSHYELQEQRGLAGALIIEPKSEPLAYDHDWVVLLADWLHSNPGHIVPDLRDPDRRKDMEDYLSSLRGMKSGDAGGSIKEPQTAPEQQPDLSDVTYDAFLLNGRGNGDPWVGTARAGDTVRLRLVNGGASTLFRFAIDGHALTVTHADGEPVEPVEVDWLMIGMGETYDILVRVAGSGSYTIRAEAQDGSGQAIGILRTPDAAPKAVAMKPSWEGRQLTYSQLRTLYPRPLPAPTRSYTLPLGGNMREYVWTIGGQMWPNAEPLVVTPGDHVQVELPNGTPMWNPMHLHGHFFRLLVDGVDPNFAPLKHTANVAPGETLRFQFVADNPGRWFFHCRNLYHLVAGMARMWVYKVPAV